MAQRVVVRLTADLSCAEIPGGSGETITFSLDGRSSVIDLTAKNANVLRRVLRPYIDAGGLLRSLAGARSASGPRPTLAP